MKEINTRKIEEIPCNIKTNKSKQILNIFYSYFHEDAPIPDTWESFFSKCSSTKLAEVENAHWFCQRKFLHKTNYKWTGKFDFFFFFFIYIYSPA